MYGNTADVKILPQKTATVPVQKNTANPFTTLSKVSDSQFGYLPNQPKNFYGGEWQIGTQTSMMDMMKKKPEEIKAWVKKQMNETSNKAVDNMIENANTWVPITKQMLKVASMWVPEDEVFARVQEMIDNGALFEWLNYEKPVDTSKNLIKDSLTQWAMTLINPLQWLTALSDLKTSFPWLGNIPWYNQVEAWAQWRSEWIVKWVRGTVEWVKDLASAGVQKMNQYNPLISEDERQKRADEYASQSDAMSSFLNRQAEWVSGRTQRSMDESVKEWIPFTVWSELGKIATTAAVTAPLWWAWLLWKAPLLSRVAMWATEWVAWNALYNKASWAEYGDNAGTAGFIGGVIPLAGAAVKWAWRLLNIWKDAKTSAIIKAISEPVNNKNAVNALREWRLTTYWKWGISETLFGAKWATIDMSKKIALASDDILKNIPKPSSKPEVLYTQIGDRVSQLWSDMSNSLKNVDVSWMKWAKNAIVKNINSEFVNNPAVKEILWPSRAKQYVSLMQNIKNAKNADELWQARKTFDMMTPNSIKEINMATASSKDKAIYEAWMWARSLINDTLDNIPFTDANVKENFRTMSSLYNAQGNIEQNIIKKVRDKLWPLSVSSIASKALPRLWAWAAWSAAYALKN